MLKIGIAHYSVGKTDGVSLEIDKRKKQLENMGHKVCLISGPKQKGADHIIKDLSIDTGIASKLNAEITNHRTTISANTLIQDFRGSTKNIKNQLDEILNTEKLDLMFVHNILALGRHPASAVAFLQILDLYRLPTICIHHDIFWERSELINTKVGFIKDIYTNYHLPHRPYIKHAVINTLAQFELKKRLSIDSEVIPDILDFDQPLWELDKYNTKAKKVLGIDNNTIVVLQATRIVPRKGIEMAIDFTYQLQQRVDKKVVLLLPNYVDSSEAASRAYAQKLLDKAKHLHVNILFAEEFFDFKRNNGHPKKRFSLWDAYALADIVTYPSLVEGWGNQFLEAVFAKKPVVVFEYPVFRADISPEGYDTISLGAKTAGIDNNGLIMIPSEKIKTAVNQALALLGNADTREAIVTKNFKIGKKYHSLTRLEKHLDNCLAFAIKYIESLGDPVLQPVTQ